MLDSSDMRRVGMRYVVEGLALGGRIVQQHIDRSSWRHSTAFSLSLFLIDKRFTRLSWKEFQTIIDIKQFSNDDSACVVEGARCLFTFFTTCFLVAVAEADRSGL